MPEHIKKKLEEEIRALEHELAHELPKEIKKAVAMGDLSENAEYHMAKQRQEFVNARLGQLKRRMGELALVNLTNIPKNCAAFGSRVRVFDNSKEEGIQTGNQRRIRCFQGADLHHFAHRQGPHGQEGRRHGDRGHTQWQTRVGSA
jgi:hypothetical protein